MTRAYRIATTLAVVFVAATAQAAAQSATSAAAQIKASDALAKLGLTVTPAKDQPAEQQAADEQVCVDETVAKLDKPTEQQKKGSKAGKGAGAGALKSGSDNKKVDKQNQEAQQKVMSEAKKQVTSCLSKKGYSVTGA